VGYPGRSLVQKNVVWSDDVQLISRVRKSPPTKTGRAARN